LLINPSPNTNQYRIVQAERLMSSDPNSLLCGLTMTRAVGRYEREIANGPALNLHSRGRLNTSISLLAASMNSRSAISVSRSCRAERPASCEN
jgi:hypothetical protein